MIKNFNDGRKFIWIKKKLSPEQREKVKNLGEPGLYFGPREVRLYPNGRFASHILGGTTFGREAVDYAELLGQAGVELSYMTKADFEAWLAIAKKSSYKNFAEKVPNGQKLIDMALAVK